MNHKWDEKNKCVNCGIFRERKTWRRLMAMVGGKDYYQYGTSFFYSLDKKKYFIERPDCNLIPNQPNT